MMKEYVSIIEDVRELKGYGNYVNIKDIDRLDRYRKQIMKYEESYEQYGIMIDFCWNNTGLD